MDDMCINSCHAFIGPFAELEACSICSEPCYDPIQRGHTRKKVPRQQACTILLGPQVQALQRSSQSAQAKLNESHSIYVDNTKVLGYTIVDTTICITVDT